MLSLLIVITSTITISTIMYTMNNVTTVYLGRDYYRYYKNIATITTIATTDTTATIVWTTATEL